MEVVQTRDRLDEIVRVAVKLFAKKGYHGTSISDITEAVGFGRSALYYHIGSKEDLLWECHQRFVEPMSAFTRQLADEPGSPAEKLRAISRRLMGIIAEYQDHIKVFYREMGALSPERFSIVVEQRRAFEDLIEGVIREGIERGEWVQENPRLCVLAFLGMHNWAYQWYNPAGPLNPDQIAETFIRIFLRGLEERPSVSENGQRGV